MANAAKTKGSNWREARLIPELGSRLAARSRLTAAGCLEWQGYVGPNGYGQIGNGRVDGRAAVLTTHRAAWLVAYGPIPDGLFVCHKCDNKKCCNADHLFLGTHRDNMQDMFRKGRRVAARGEESGQAKLTDEQVAEIRRRFVPGKKPGSGYPTNAPALAREFGITPWYVHQLVKGHWRNCA